MRLVTYSNGSATNVSGVVVDGAVVPSAAAAYLVGASPEQVASAGSTRGVLAADIDLSDLAGAAQTLSDSGSPLVSPQSSVRLETPVPDPDKIICVGLNYRDHAAEAGLDLPAAPILFAKYRNSLCAADANIKLPAATDEVDWEGELAVVIGRRCHDVAEDDALAVVAGVMAANDLSARDLQNRTSQWLPGKAIDGFAPCGPELVTLDEIGDIQHLDITTTVNDETVQAGNTASMLFSVAEIIAFCTTFMTLEPGDIILTGTPAGVGFSRTPPMFLTAGDAVSVDIAGVGRVANTLIAPVLEPA